MKTDTSNKQDDTQNASAVRDCPDSAGSKHWSDETEDGKCAKCNTPTILVSALPEWEVDSEANHEQAGWSVEVHEEITGHWCPECHAMRSMSFNS